MKKDVQNIRKSQFVLSYGPGSIIEGKNGSRLMPSIDTGMTWYMSKEFLEKNEISDIRMSNIVESFEDREIDSGVGLFSLPSNSSLNIASDSRTASRRSLVMAPGQRTPSPGPGNG